MNRFNSYLKGSLLTLILATPLLAKAQSSVAETGSAMLGKVGNAVGGTIDGVGKTLGKAGDAITSDKSVPEMRAEIDNAASKTLNRLIAGRKAARILNEKAYGYAVFDTRKFSFLLTTGTGSGVVVDKKTGKRVYMHMATGGAGVGMGMQFYQLVVFFENKQSLERFINQGLEATGAAAAVFGEDSLAANVRFVEGMATFQLTDAGIMAAANVTGTRYWKSKELN